MTDHALPVTTQGRVDATPLYDRIEAVEADLAKTREQLQGVEERLQTTERWIQDWADESLLIAPDPEPAPIPEPVRPIDPTPPEDTTPTADIQHELNKGGTVRLPGGTNIYGTLRITQEATELVCEEGKRPTVWPERDQPGIVNDTKHIDTLLIRGIAVDSKHRDLARGVQVRLDGKEGRFVNTLIIDDCKVRNCDTSYEVVDPWALKQPKGTPGRIRVHLINSISGPAFGSDSHSIGAYLEGLNEGSRVLFCVFDQSGWITQAERNKKSHSIYMQEGGAPLELAHGNVLSRAAANAAQFRAGCLNFTRNLITGCSLGPWLRWGNLVANNVLLDQVDIQPPDNDPDTPDTESRGHGYILGGCKRVHHNLAARRHGSLGHIPAFKDVQDWTDLQDNVAVEWERDDFNFDLAKTLHNHIGTNRTLPEDPGIPYFTEIDKHLNRERGEKVIGTNAFIEQCWEVIPS